MNKDLEGSSVLTAVMEDKETGENKALKAPQVYQVFQRWTERKVLENLEG